MILAILSLCLAPASPLQEGLQELPPGIPQPTLFQRGDSRPWVSLRPFRDWTEGDDLPRSAEDDLPADRVEVGLRELGAFLAVRNDWNDRSVRAWKRASRPRSVPFRFELRAPDGEQVLLSAREVIPLLQPVAFRDLRKRSVIRDFDVEIAQRSSIADPIQDTQYAGLSLAVELIPLPGVGYRAEFAVVDTAFLPLSPIDTHYDAIQGADRLPEALTESGFTTLLQVGKERHFSLPGRQGNYELVVACGGEPVVVSIPAGEGIQTCFAPSLAVSEDWEAFVHELQRHGDTSSFGVGYLAFGDEHASEQVERVLERVRARAHARELNATLVEVGKEGERRLVDFRGALMVGRPLRLAQGRTAQALMDWGVEVACDARIADPDFTSLFDGVRGSFRLDEEGALDVDLELSGVDFSASRLLTLSADIPGGESADGPTPAMPADRVAVDLPEVRRTSLRGRYWIGSDGKLVVERDAAGFLGPGGKLRLEVQFGPAD